LSVNTVKAYLCALSQLQSLTGFGKGKFVSDPWVKILLKGKENAKFYESAEFNKVKPVLFEILRLIGHQIMRCDWSEYIKVVLVTSFDIILGFFCIGESI